ncbi:MAG TPA: ABC transporter permease, partial [Puia sp.]|nr:ABC transporter permease [Puia sp.]
MLKKQLLFALRRLSRHKLNTSINILGLTLGILACLVIFLIVSFEFSYDTFHPNGDRIYRVITGNTGSDGILHEGAGVPAPLGADLRRESTGFTAVTGFYTDESKVQVPNATGKAPRIFAGISPGQPKHIAFADPQFLQIFQYDWLAGNPQTALTQPFSVVLTEAEARRYFEGGDPQSWVGRTLVYHDSLTVSVTGIVADWKANSDLRFADLISYSTIEHSWLKKEIDGWNLYTTDAQAYVLLPTGETPAQAKKQFPAFIARHKLSKDDKTQLSLQPLAEIHFNGQITDTYGRRAHKPTLYGLAGIALFVLLIASINFINLSTAQAVQRAREVGVRKVLGSSRLGLTGQFLIETAFIVLGSMALALLLANPVIHAFSGFIPAGVHIDLSKPLTLAFILGSMILTCLLAGWYPARVLSSFLPVISLRGQGVQSLNSRSGLRKALIVFQFTISLLFIIATMVVGRQMNYMLNTDLGFNRDAILSVELPWGQPRNKKAVLATAFSQLSGVEKVSLTSSSPASEDHPGTMMEYKGATNVKIEAGADVVDTNYLSLYGLTLVAGRNFFIADTAHNEGGPPPGSPASTPGAPAPPPPYRAFIINESAAKALGFRRPADAIGQSVTTGFSGTLGPIIGVLKDYHHSSFRQAIVPFFLTMTNNAGAQLGVQLGPNYRTPAQAKELIARLEKSFKTVYPDADFSAHFLDDTLQQLYEKEQKTAAIMNLSMAVAIFISCMGLFGLAAYTASQRTREIGIRKVLGAGVPRLVTMLSKDFILLVGLATLIAAPLAGWATHQWLQDFAYRTSVPWWIYASAGLGALAIALVT